MRGARKRAVLVLHAGVPGAFLAVPIIATIKALGEHLEGLAPVAEFLSD
jgi:predicted PurR-regulated permease PerM